MTPEELESYQRQGYVVVRGLFSADEIAPWLERLAAIVRGEVPRSERMVVMRDVMVAKGAVAPKSQEESIAKLQDFDPDPVLRATPNTRSCSTASRRSSASTWWRSTTC